jgi:hypothetical protein
MIKLDMYIISIVHAHAQFLKAHTHIHNAHMHQVCEFAIVACWEQTIPHKRNWNPIYWMFIEIWRFMQKLLSIWKVKNTHQPHTCTILFLLLVNPKHMLYFHFTFHDKRYFVCFIASTNWTQIHTYFYIIVIPKQLQLIVVVKEKNEINPHKYLKMCSHHLYNKRQTTIDLFECFST